jgi:hypothetical protein
VGGAQAHQRDVPDDSADEPGDSEEMLLISITQSPFLRWSGASDLEVSRCSV